MNIAAVFPSRDSGLGLGSWAREMVATAACTANPPPYPDDNLPLGDGHTVLLVPGFLAGDWTLDRLRHFISRLNYRTETADILFNAGPTAGMLMRLDDVMERIAAGGRKISIVGQSLGGVLARELAKKHPRKIRRVVTLGSPIRFPVTTPLAPMAALFQPFHDKASTAELHRYAEPPPVPVTAIYSEEDGIVDWRQCLQDEAFGYENVRVSGAHTTMGSNPDAQRAVAGALARPF